MNGLLVSKIVALTLLGGSSLLFGLAPLFFHHLIPNGRADNKLNLKQSERRKKWSKLFVSGVSCLAAGIIITTCFCNMLPEVNSSLQLNIQAGVLPDTGMPLGEIFVLCGFFMIYIIEEIGHSLIHKCEAKAKLKTADTHKGPEDPLATQQEEHQSDHDDEIPIELLAGQDGTFKAAMRGMMVVLALSLHDLFEGIAMGLSHSTSYVWYLLIASVTHKVILAFCIGLQFVSSGISKLLVILYISIFSLISSVGVGIGIALTETITDENSIQTSVVTILQGLAAGTLLYVVFFEILEKERQKDVSGLFQVTFIAIGFVFMTLLHLLEANSHSDPLPVPCELHPPVIDHLHYPVNITCTNGVLQFME